MSEKQETIADIIAEMRRGTRLPGYWRSCDVNEILQYHADRLEAALERETDKLQQQHNECARDYNDAQRARSAANSEIAELKKQIGNGAKMREAVLEARRFVFAAKQGQRDLLVNDKISEPYVIKAKDTLAKIDAALAAPPRNCDVGTADKQFKQWRAFCDRHDADCTGCPCDNSYTYTLAYCLARWGQLPYEEGGAK